MKTPADYERMRQAKADKRQALAAAPTTQEVGRAIFSGSVFGGIHTVRILSVDDGRAVYDFEIDGILRGYKTARGLRSALARLLSPSINSRTNTITH